MKIVAVGAHPDDIEFGCYGTLAKWMDNNEIFLFVFSAGEINAPRENRIKEAKKSAEIIDANIEFFNYKDGKIPFNDETVRKLGEKIKKIKPDIVFTQFPFDTHQDHWAVSKITIASCRLFVPRIYYYEAPATETSFRPNYYVDITNFINFKIKALKCFESQLSKPYFDLEQVKAIANYRAYKIFKPKRLFEAFQIYRIIV